jgi:hypothetical protein
MKKIWQNRIKSNSSRKSVTSLKLTTVFLNTIEEIEEIEQRESDWLSQQMYLQDDLGFYL